MANDMGGYEVIKPSSQRRSVLIVFDFFLILFLGSLPVLLKGQPGIINWVDNNVFFRFTDTGFREALYIWHRFDANFGKNTSALFTPQLPYLSLQVFLTQLGLSIEWKHAISTALCLSAVGWAAYYLVAVLNLGSGRQRTALLGSIFAMYNPLTLSLIRINPETRYLSIATTFTLLAFFINGLRNKRQSTKYAILAAFTLLVATSTQSAPLVVIRLYLPLLFLAAFALKRGFRGHIKHVVVFVVLTGLLAFLLNSYWLFPTLAHLGSTVQKEAQLYTSRRTSQLAPTPFEETDVLRKMLVQRYEFGAASDPYEGYYSSPAVLLTGVFLIIVAYAALFFSRDRRTAFFAACAVLFTGVWAFALTPPFFDIWLWFSRNIPLSTLIFQVLVDRHAPLVLVAYTVLLGISLTNLGARFRAWSFSFLGRRFNGPFFYAVLCLFVSSLIIVNALPLILSKYGNPKSVSVPAHYFSAGRWLGGQEEEFRILSIPHHYRMSYIRYTWQPYSSVDIIQQSGYVFPKPVIQVRPLDTSQPDIVNSATALLYGQMDGYSSVTLRKILSLMNAKYVLVRRDVLPNERHLTTDVLLESLDTQTGLSLERIFSGELYFYRVESYLPLVYASVDPIVVSGDGMQILPNIIGSIDPDNNPYLVSSSEQGFECLGDEDCILDHSDHVSYLFSHTGGTFYVPKEGNYTLIARISPIDTLVETLPLSIDSEQNVALSKFPLAMIDGRPILFQPFTDQEDSRGWEEYRLAFKEMRLTAGLHKMEILTYPTFEVNLVELRPHQPHLQTADVSFRQINPTRYEVSVETETDFWLVFSEAFHSGWHAYIEGVSPGQQSTDWAVYGKEPRQVSLEAQRPWYEWSAVLSWLSRKRNRTELTYHHLVNSYANGWYVPTTGKYTIILEYTPQRLFEIGVIISGITLLGCVGYLVRDWKRRRWE